jgi:hypothetical protein
MRKITTSLVAIVLSALALGLVNNQAAYAQYVGHGPVLGPDHWDRPVYETYHAGNTNHFYTIDRYERDSAVYFGYADYGVAFVLDQYPHPAYSAPFRRFYNPTTTDHFYTADPAEVDYVLSHGWYEQAQQSYIYTSQVWDDVTYTIPLYRLNKWDSVTGDQDHLYTASWSTVQFAQSLGWAYDGIKGYVWPAGHH